MPLLRRTPKRVEWAVEEAARLLSDDDVAGRFGIGEPLDGIHPSVEAEMVRMWSELEADDAS